MSNRSGKYQLQAFIYGSGPTTIALLLAILVISGCGGEPEKKSERPATVGGRPDTGFAMVNAPDAWDASQGPPVGDAAVESTVSRVMIAPWDEIAAAVKGSGKLTVVDVWSLACEPCMKEFPGLVNLHQQYGEQLNCVSVNVDFDGRRTHPPEGYTTQVQQFLNFNNAELNNYICATPSDMVFETLDIVSIPAVLIFDAQGNEITRFVDAGDTRGFTYERNVAPAIEKLLATPTDDVSSDE